MRIRFLPLLLVIAALVAACDKPSEADCKKAIENINKLHDITMEPGKVASAVRKCQASSSKSSVKCMGEATSVEQANACK